MTRRSALPGPEWNPILVILAILAGLTVLATFHWFLGVAGLFALFVGVCVYGFMVRP